MKTSAFSLLLAGGLIVGAGLWPAAAQTTDPQTPDPALPTDPTAAKPPSANPDVAKAKQMMKVMSLSPGLAEIVKLKEAGVEDQLIVQFVQNAPVASYPTAEDIITLRENNISPPIIGTLLQRSGELRQRAAETAPAAPAPAPAPAPAQAAAAPAPTVVQSPIVYTAPATYAVAAPVVYSTPAYNYGYGCYPRSAGAYTVYSGGAYYGYGSGYYPSVSVGLRFGGNCGSGYYGAGYYGGYRGGYYGGYRGGYRGCR